MESPARAVIGTGSKPSSINERVCASRFARFTMLARTPPGAVPGMSETNVTLSEWPGDNSIGLETISPSGSTLVPGLVTPRSLQLMVAATAMPTRIEETFRSGSDIITVQAMLSPAY